ncbi:MAG: patatin-like phospholipase family protein [Chloroflexi bacterium]|nr:patatin-like phospholipase family protein [Chloroflexota bacterium]
MGIKGAPELRKRKVGLALGSGAARGLAHIGVLEVLEKEGIPIDMIAGSSMGALIGALYAQGKDVGLIKNLAIDLGSKRFALLADPALPKTGLIRGRKIEDTLRLIFGDIKFGDLGIPFACVATDVETGEEAVIKQGLVWQGVRASGSIPVILSAVKRQGRYLVDGALANPVPVSVLKEMGADFIIAVNVTPDLRERIHRIGEEQVEAKEPNILNVIMQMVHIIGYRVVESSLVGADVIIEPQVTHIGWGDFRRVPECILQGELAARSCVLEIKRKLEGRKRY